MNKNSICVLGVYFGKLPAYFNLWLKSCEYNPKIDFIIFTDNQIIDLPPNVTVYKSSLKEIKDRASAVLEFECSLGRAYKLCDYKPLYGSIFSKELKGYDYWGHCDFDLIFGDINQFFEWYNLYEYDKINALGHLSFYRNTDEINSRYKLEGGRDNYKKVFTSDTIYVFDEMPGMTELYRKHGFSMFTKYVYADIASVYERFRIIEEYALDEKKKNYKDQIFYWENGKCFRAYYVEDKLYKEEYMYIHFKKRRNFSVDFDEKSNASFYITQYGFIPKNGEVTLGDIKKYNPCNLKKEFAVMLKFKIIKITKNCLRPLYATIRKLFCVGNQ